MPTNQPEIFYKTPQIINFYIFNETGATFMKVFGKVLVALFIGIFGHKNFKQWGSWRCNNSCLGL